MAFGAIFRDEAGNINSDFTTALSRKIGTVTTGTSNGSISVPALSGGIGWYAVLPLSGSNVAALAPSVNISGTTLSWTFPVPASAVNSLIIYGTR